MRDETDVCHKVDLTKCNPVQWCVHSMYVSLYFRSLSLSSTTSRSTGFPLLVLAFSPDAAAVFCDRVPSFVNYQSLAQIMQVLMHLNMFHRVLYVLLIKDICVWGVGVGVCVCAH